MTAVSAMVHRCWIETPQFAGTDEDGQPLPAEWGIKYFNVPCTFWRTSRVESVDENRTQVVEDLRMNIPLSFAVTESDRVAFVTNRLGEIIDPSIMNVRGVARNRTHKELELQAVTSG